MKKLYLLTQNENNGYDSYDSCIVCAESEEQAKTISPGCIDDVLADCDEKSKGCYTNNSSDWATTTRNVTCELIANNATCEIGVVLSSFNAG